MRSHLGVLVVLIAAALGLGACTGDSEPPVVPSPPSHTSSPTPERVVYEVDRVLDDVVYLADDIGPRHATSDAYAEAADWVEKRLDSLGLVISRQEVDVPAGVSWGVDVEAGTSSSVIADTPGLDPAAPHVVLGAHLDTIAVAPGAEDNASGVAVMLELARLVADGDRPVRMIAFAAEEPRGTGDALHHFGSQQYVAALSEDERDAIEAMVSLDRVGVDGPDVPICTGGSGTAAIRDALAAAAERSGTPHRVCGDNTTSDHWSFEKAGVPSARLGSIPYDGYHSAEDTPEVVSADQLERVGAIMADWLGQGP